MRGSESLRKRRAWGLGLTTRPFGWEGERSHGWRREKDEKTRILLAPSSVKQTKRRRRPRSPGRGGAGVGTLGRRLFRGRDRGTKPTGSEGALVSLRDGEMLAVARPCALRVVRVVDASCELTAVGYFKQEERRTYQGRGCGSEGTEAFSVVY